MQINFVKLVEVPWGSDDVKAEYGIPDKKLVAYVRVPIECFMGGDFLDWLSATDMNQEKLKNKDKAELEKFFKKKAGLIVKTAFICMEKYGENPVKRPKYTVKFEKQN